jgi:hypothetical protein
VPTILKSLPYLPVPLYLPGVPKRAVDILPYQIFIWVSLTPPGTFWKDLSSKPRPFPVLLDTGCNHNFSIQEEILQPYAGLDTKDLPPTEPTELSVDGLTTPFYEADLWIYHNKPGRRDELLDIEPFHIELNGGTGVYRPNAVRPDRPPVLGLQALTGARCHLLMDCNRCLVSLRTNKPLILL